MPRKGAVLVSCAPGSGHAARVRTPARASLHSVPLRYAVGTHRPGSDTTRTAHAAHNRTADRHRIDSSLHVRWPFEQRDAASAHPFCDGVAEELHYPRQIDFDAHSIVQHLDPAGDPLPHYRRDEVQGLPLPVVIEPAKEDAELGLQAVDATVEPAPCLLPAQPVWDRKRSAAATSRSASSFTRQRR
jgi:hypothetical protein